jgi:hypothetical protein
LSYYEDWHRKLGHPNSVVLSHLFKNGLLGNKNVVSNGCVSCSVCKLAKSKTLPFPSGAYRASTCFKMIHSDVWGISPVVLLPLLMIIIFLLGYIFLGLNLKCFLCLRNL